MKKASTGFLFSLLLGSVAALAEPIRFQAVDPIGRNTIAFRTTAPLEDIVGTTSKIQGEIRVDPRDLQKGEAAGRFEVELASLRTGISLRDSHMRDQYLHTGRFPAAVFTFERIRKASARALEPNKPVTLTAEGTFELHGVRRKIEVPVKVTYLPESPSTMGKLPGNLLRVTSEFDVRLADYNIERPQMVLLKVGEVARVTLDVFTTDADSQKLSMWMEQMKRMMGGE